MNVQELKEKITNLRSFTSWEDIEVEKMYHIPPIASLERRDIRITSKKGDAATYYRIGDKDKTERTMYKTSVFAKFLVKRKKY